MFTDVQSLSRIITVVLLVMLAVSVKNLLSVHKNIRYFLKKRSFDGNQTTRFFIFVPLMNEEKAVSGLVDSLTSMSYPADKTTIVLVTTVRERDPNGNNPTHEAAKKAANLHNNQKTGATVIAVESTKTNGYVATQINFAIEQLGAQIKPDDFLVTYNADSSPAVNTLLAADKIVQEHGSKVNVMQQSSLFTKNVSAMLEKRNFSAAASAIHQSLWTLKHEVSMMRRQSKLSELWFKNMGAFKRFCLTKFTVCVGHGLFVRKSYYDTHPLNEDASIEDTHYGLYQSLRRVGVYPIPLLENSESPSTFRRVTAQKRGWFRLVFDLSGLLFSNGQGKFKRGQGRAEFLSILLQVSLVYVVWFMHSIFIVGTLVIAAVSQQASLVGLWLATYAAYWLLPALLLAYYHDRLVVTGRLNASAVLAAWTIGAPGILTHSLGPWLSISDRLRGLNTRTKTER